MTRKDAAFALTAPDKDALLASLLEQVEALTGCVEILEGENEALREENEALRSQLNLPQKTPRNSSKPPSSAPKANGDKEGKAKARRKGRAGSHRALHPDPTHHHDARLDQCPPCRADVGGVPQQALQAYDHIEIPEIRPDVTRVTLYGGVCPCCAERFKAPAPAGMEPGSPFGTNLRAFMLYLRYDHAISFERLERIAWDLFGLEISEGALANILRGSAPAFGEQMQRLRTRLLSGTAIESDETGVRVGKKSWWLWVFHHGDSACFVIAPSRGKKVVAAFLGDHRPEIWVSDRLAAQMGWGTQEHQVCLAHLLRDIQYAIDCGDSDFGPKLKDLLKRAIRIGRRRSRLADSSLRAYEGRLNRDLDERLKQPPPTEAGQKLQQMIKGCRPYLFVFLKNRAIPATNNGSEQALRPCTIFRKVTNCFRSEWGAKLYADIRSVIETARRRRIGALQAIRLTLLGKPLPCSA